MALYSLLYTTLNHIFGKTESTIRPLLCLHYMRCMTVCVELAEHSRKCLAMFHKTSSGTSSGNLDKVLAIKSCNLFMCKKLAQSVGQMLLSMHQKSPKNWTQMMLYLAGEQWWPCLADWLHSGYNHLNLCLLSLIGFIYYGHQSIFSHIVASV